MIRRIGIIAAIMIGFYTVNVSAQKAVITFDEKAYDFGQIKEDGGNVSHIFEFTNTGTTPLVIQRVNASCGCTTPEWTQTPIESGKKGKVTAIYSPMGRPGAFTKEVYVYSNAKNEMERLTITGNVIPRSSSNASQANSYPIQMGDLKLNSKVIQMNNVEKGLTQSRNIGIQNVSNTNLTVTFTDIPAYLNINVNPKVLKPNETGTIGFTFDSSKATEWGPIDDKINVVLDGKKNAGELYKIIFQVNVIENFSKASAAQKRQAPIFEVKSNNLYLGSIKQGSRVRGKLAVKNVGSNPLEIRRIVNNNSDIIISPMRMSIKGGHTDNLKIEVDSKFLPKGEYKKAFTMQTNDPVNTYSTFTVSYKVL
ncbi:MAG: DUF1573 domain-containing protein [Paludibacteraceae bacterium]